MDSKIKAQTEKLIEFDNYSKDIELQLKDKIDKLQELKEY